MYTSLLLFLFGLGALGLSLAFLAETTPNNFQTSLTAEPTAITLAKNPEAETKPLDTTPMLLSEAANNPAPVLTKVAAVSKNKATPVLPRPEIMAWIYPGQISCTTKSEYSDGRKIDILKPEYFMIAATGELTLLTEAKRGCNGYSSANIADIKKHSKAQYVTVSSSDATSMDLFLTRALQDTAIVNTLVSFVADNNITGVELDFEDYGGWQAAAYEHYKLFVSDLGNALHKRGKKLMIDGPATSNGIEESWYMWRYTDFNQLPVDRLVVMTYDYQFDQGAGEPVSPVFWIRNTITWITRQFPDLTKITFGVPSYGYKSTVGTNKFTLLTYAQIKKEPGFDTAERDPESFEMTWQHGSTVYFYQDSFSMDKKLAAIQSMGIPSVSVWHLGENLWFSH